MPCGLPHLPKYGVLLVEFIGPAKREEELAAVVVGAAIGHGYQPPPSELEALVEFILHNEMSSQKHANMNWKSPNTNAQYIHT